MTERGETDRGPGWHVPPAGLTGNVTEVFGLLLKAAAGLDQMWHETLLSAAPHAVMSLGEASHGDHRAPIALNHADRFEPTVGIARAGMVGAGRSG
jgi:hypothetical protein